MDAIFMRAYVCVSLCMHKNERVGGWQMSPNSPCRLIALVDILYVHVILDGILRQFTIPSKRHNILR